MIPKEKEVVEGSDMCNVNDLDTFVKKMLNQEAKQLPENTNLLHSMDNEIPDKFRQFDMASDCSDHNFVTAGKGFTLSQVRTCYLWTKLSHSSTQDNPFNSLFIVFCFLVGEKKLGKEGSARVEHTRERSPRLVVKSILSHQASPLANYCLILFVYFSIKFFQS